MSDFNCLTCCTCGIDFGFPKKIADIWLANKKGFFCPNGHPLTWKETDSVQDKELKSLRKEVKELKDKLLASQDEVAVLKKKITELESELEIWAPSKTEEIKDESKRS